MDRAGSMTTDNLPPLAKIIEAGELYFNEADPDPKAEADIRYSRAMIVQFDSPDDLVRAIREGTARIQWHWLTPENQTVTK